MCTGETGDLKIQQSDFLRAFWPNKYNCKRLNLKVKDIQYNVGVIKNYCIKSVWKKSAQFINSFLRYSRF